MYREGNQVADQPTKMTLKAHHNTLLIVHFSGGNRTMGSSLCAQDGMGDGHQKAYSRD